MNQTPDKPAMRFLAFENDEEDAQTKAKLKEAAEKIEQAIARERSLNELIDYRPPDEESVVDLANDTRPLYERLLEQKNKKQEAFDDSTRLSNLVVKLDEDDANYLNDVARVKQEEEIKKRLEIYDALEEKKKMSEKRILEDERRMKEILIGSKTNDRSSTSTFKSKFSSLIKVKPKTKPNPLDSKSSHDSMNNQDSPNHINETELKKEPPEAAKDTDVHNGKRKNMESTHSHGESEESKQDDHREKKACASQSEKVMKCIGILPSLPLVANVSSSSEDQTQDDHGGKKGSACEPKEVMKCIGILPSLPLVEDPSRSSDESDDSADNLEVRIVPRVGKKRRR